MVDDGIREEVGRLAPRVVEWRRALHRHPELGFEEHRTAAFVEERLRELGLEVHTGLAHTGVAGILRAGRAERAAVLLRADMDALPIQEVEGREYGSEIAGRMHACGHDGHTAMLLGAATLLASRREELRRDVLFCFQPGEEGQGGGRLMIEEGILDLLDVESVFGLHLWSPVEAGKLQVRPGPMMAAQDEFSVRVIGRGGHAALPHTTLDPIVAGAHVVTALQTVVSRFVDPVAPAVLSVGSFHAGTAGNVIPEEAHLEGTLRSFTDEVRELLRHRAKEAAVGAAAAVGCRAEFEVRPGYPAVVNDPAAVEALRSVAAEVFGESQVEQLEPIAAAEDFAYFLRERPGAFAFLGAGNQQRGITAPHHSPRFDIDESVLPRGVELFVRLALAK